MNTQATENKRNQDISTSVSGVGDYDGSGKIGKNIKNLSTVIKFGKYKKLKLTKTKKSDFAEDISSKTDFLIFKVKKTFIY